MSSHSGVSAAVGDFAGARTDEPIEKRIARLEDIEAIQRLKAIAGPARVATAREN